MSSDFVPVESLVHKAVQYLEKIGYSYSSVKRYHKCWKTLLEICQKRNIRYFCYESCLPIMLAEWRINPLNSVSHFQRFQIRSLKCLHDFQHDGTFSKCYRDKRIPASLFCPETVAEYEKHLKENGLKTSTILNKKHIISHFLQYLSEQNISGLATLSPQLVIQYLKYLENSSFSPSTKGLYLGSIKKFLEFLYLRQDITAPLHRMFIGNSFSKYVRLPSQYKREELKALLSAIDRNSFLGRRDYLVMLLTMQLGIRTGDLCRLEMENIRWETDAIQFVQQKTGKEQILPMPENVKYAMLDYLKNSRPQVPFSQIFIKPRAPHTPYENTNPFYNIVKKYMDIAGISYSGRKHGLHAMRHSLAGNLLTEGVDFPVISGILGHTSTEATMRYAGIDITALRRIALEVPYER